MTVLLPDMARQCIHKDVLLHHKFATTVSQMCFNTTVSFAILDTILSQKEPKAIRITTKWTLLRGLRDRQMGHRVASQRVVMLWEKRKPLGREMEKTQVN